jgi:hypothetical protein
MVIAFRAFGGIMAVHYSRRLLPLASILVALATVPAHAQLTLTVAGSADGFSLSTFATGFPNPGGAGCCGPLGLSLNGLGQVIVDSSQNSTNYVFTDVDGQTLGSAVTSSTFNAFPPAMALSNGSTWTSGGFSGPNAGNLIKLNNDGSINTVYTSVSGISSLDITNGMWTDPVNGHIIAYGNGNIYDIDVSGATPTGRVAVTGAGDDGLTVSPDGSTVYMAAPGGIEGWSLATGAVVFPFLSVPGGTVWA